MTATKKKKQDRSIHNPATSLTSDIILEYLGGGSRTSAAGTRVTANTALTVAPVWQAVDVITSDISRIPICVKRTNGRDRTIDRAHPVHKLLTRWTGYTTANAFLIRLLAHALLHGNGYAIIRRRGSKPDRLQWMRADQVEPDWERGQYFYLVQYDTEKDGEGGYDRIHPLDMIHIPGLMIDEYGGLSLVQYARNVIGREMAAEGYADDFFNNGAVPSGWFEHPTEMSKEAYERFLLSVERRHRGNGKRHKIGILEEGMQWKPAGIDPVDALLIDQLKWGTKDVARFFNLPPHKLGDDSKANYNSLEQENKAYYDSSLGKWISRLTCEFNAKLFTEAELDNDYRVEFDVDSWGKADTASRFAAYAIALQWGILNPNEVREKEGHNPYEGGDEYMRPLTHGGGQDPAATQDPPPEDDQPEDDPPPDQVDESQRAAIYDVVRDRCEEVARLLTNSATRAAKREGNFLAAINGLSRKHQAAVEGKLSPVVHAATGSLEGLSGVVSRVFREASDRFVSAAECRPEKLIGSVSDAGESLRLFSRDLARELVYGGKQ